MWCVTLSQIMRVRVTRLPPVGAWTNPFELPPGWEQGLLRLPFVWGLLRASPAPQRSCVEAVKVLAMQADLLF